MATKLEEGGGVALMAWPLVEDFFFAASLIYQIKFFLWRWARNHKGTVCTANWFTRKYTCKTMIYPKLKPLLLVLEQTRGWGKALHHLTTKQLNTQALHFKK